MNQAVQVDSAKKIRNSNALGQKGFFIISKKEWEYLYEIDATIKDMASFLVLACGTGPDHKTTSWSAGAVYEYTGISPKPATKAIMRLNVCGAITTKKVAQKNKLPIYKLRFEKNPKTDKDGDNIYIPSGVVTGVRGEDSPLKRLVNYQNRELLYLFIRLYAFQDKFLDCISPEIISSALYDPCGLEIEAEYNESGLLDLYSFNSKKFTLSALVVSDFFNFPKIDSPVYDWSEDPFYFEWNDEDGEHHEARGVWGFYKHLMKLGLIQETCFICKGEQSLPDELDILCEIDYQQNLNYMQIMSEIHRSKGKQSFIYDIDVIRSNTYDFMFAVIPSKYKKVHAHKLFKMTYKTKVGASKAGYALQKEHENEVKFLLEKVK